MERKSEGKGSVSGDTFSGLSQQMEDNVRSSALFYSLFFVNTFFTCGWLFLSMTVLSQLTASLYVILGGGVSLYDPYPTHHPTLHHHPHPGVPLF